MKKKKNSLWGQLLRRLRNKKEEINCLSWGKSIKLAEPSWQMFKAFQVHPTRKGNITAAEVSTSESRGQRFKTHSQVRQKKDKSIPQVLQRKKEKTKMIGKVDKAGIHEMFRPGRHSKDITKNKNQTGNQNFTSCLSLEPSRHYQSS